MLGCFQPPRAQLLLALTQAGCGRATWLFAPSSSFLVHSINGSQQHKYLWRDPPAQTSLSALAQRLGEVRC